MGLKALYTRDMNAKEIATDQGSSLEAPPRFLSITGLFAGPLLAVGVYFLLLWQAPDLAHAPRATAAIAVLMAVWWMTEAIALEATSLLPLVLLPLLGVYWDDVRVGDRVTVKESRLVGKVVAIDLEKEEPEAEIEFSTPTNREKKVEKITPSYQKGHPTLQHHLLFYPFNNVTFNLCLFSTSGIFHDYHFLKKS